MSRASDTTKGAAESYAGVVRQRPSGGVPRKRLRPLATFGGRMHPSDWSRLLTERQREVLTIVVENKVYRNRDSKIPELAAQMGIAPAAVAKHLLEIEKTALLNVVVSPSEQGKRVYERLELEPRPEQKQTAEVLDRNTVTILRFLHVRPDASVTEVAEELGFSEYTTVNSLRVLMAVQLITQQRGPALRRAVAIWRYASSEGWAALRGDPLHGHQDPQAVDWRVFGETELLGNFGHARIRVEVQEAKDRDGVPVQGLRGLLLLRPRLELEPLVDALALFGR